VIDTLILLGATGDLSGRFLFPSIAELGAAGRLGDGFRVVGAALSELDDATFLAQVAGQLEQHAGAVPEAARTDLLRALRYRQVDLLDAQSVADLLREVTGGAVAEPVAVYLALPQSLFVPTVRSLGAAALPARSRIVVEKPWGEDLGGVMELNRLLADAVGPDAEQAVFRVDHVLGLATTPNLLALRLANRIFEPVWNGRHIEQVELLWEETLALEGRASFYDRAGALMDVIHSHLLQVLCLVALEPPARYREAALRERKVEVLRSLSIPGIDEMAARTRRARYTAGRLSAVGGAGGEDVADYAAEQGVDPGRKTETFAEVELALDSERWVGTRFILRAGKAMAHRRKGVVVTFRQSTDLLFAGDPSEVANTLWVGLDGPDDIRLRLAGAAAGSTSHLLPLILAAQPPEPELSAYARVLLNVLEEDSALSVGAEHAVEAWRVVAPILQAWAANRVPLEEYPAGSSGPPRRAAAARGA
jgi:glucose-6-phosphate 1-dehydrogenase